MEKGSFTSRDGLTLMTAYFLNETASKVICLVHGMGEHKGRYEHVVDFFAKNGYSVALFDQRGHGESGGKRGHTPSLNALLDDVEDFLKYVAELFPNQKQILMGHSMGGNVVLNYTLRRQPNIHALVASSPYIRLAFEPPKMKVLLAKTVGSILGTLSQKTGLDSNFISRDKKVVEEYNSDPLVHDNITPSFFNSVHFTGDELIERASEFRVPTLMYHGTEDSLTSSSATTEMASKSGGSIDLKLWAGLYHECHNEPEKEQVLQFVIDWLKNK